MKQKAADIRSAVEELLGYESPVQATTRAAKDSLGHGQVHIKPGEVIGVDAWFGKPGVDHGRPLAKWTEKFQVRWWSRRV